MNTTKRHSPKTNSPKNKTKGARDVAKKGELSTIIEEIHENDLPVISFWGPFFDNHFEQGVHKIYDFKAKMQHLLYNPAACRYIQEKIPKYYAATKEYEHYLCFIFIVFGYLSNLLQHEYILLIKGGKAVQIALSSIKQNASHIPKYESDDVDILVMPNKMAKISAQQMAIELGNFIVWLTSSYDMQSGYYMPLFSSMDKPVSTGQEGAPPQIGSIVKLALITGINSKGRHTYFAVSDIGYVMPEKADIFQKKTSVYGFTIPDYNLRLHYSSVDITNLILEKLHYIILYNSAENSRNPYLDKFRASLHRSINALLEGLAISKLTDKSINPASINLEKYKILFEYLDKYAGKFDMIGNVHKLVFDKGVNAKEVFEFILSPKVYVEGHLVQLLEKWMKDGDFTEKSEMHKEILGQLDHLLDLMGKEKNHMNKYNILNEKLNLLGQDADTKVEMINSLLKPEPLPEPSPAPLPKEPSPKLLPVSLPKRSPKQSPVPLPKQQPVPSPKQPPASKKRPNRSKKIRKQLNKPSPKPEFVSAPTPAPLPLQVSSKTSSPSSSKYASAQSSPQLSPDESVYSTHSSSK